jgi:hypothetical protein
VVHPTWIDVAYTWSWPGSGWTAEALRMLEDQSIYQVGRYGRWQFQGIADSIRDGFVAGRKSRAFRARRPRSVQGAEGQSAQRATRRQA